MFHKAFLGQVTNLSTQVARFSSTFRGCWGPQLCFSGLSVIFSQFSSSSLLWGFLSFTQILTSSGSTSMNCSFTTVSITACLSPQSFSHFSAKSRTRMTNSTGVLFSFGFTIRNHRWYVGLLVDIIALKNGSLHSVIITSIVIAA